MPIHASIKGFTLIELILLIVIISILSFFAVSRFFGVDSFAAYALQDQAVSVVRQVQVNRMQSNIESPGDDFRLTVTSDCLGSVAACNANDAVRASRSDWVVSGNSSFTITSPSTGLNTIDFSLLGNPLNDAATGVTIRIGDNNQNNCIVRINQEGFVSKGGCS